MNRSFELRLMDEETKKLQTAVLSATDGERKVFEDSYEIKSDKNFIQNLIDSGKIEKRKRNIWII